MVRASPPDAAPRVGYVLKKFPRLSETFVLDEVLAVEAAGVDTSIYSLRPPDDEPCHADAGRIRARARYLPRFGSASTMSAFRALRNAGDTAIRLDRALAFLDRLPEERRASILIQALCLADAASAQGVEHLHAHFMTVAAHTAYIAHLLTGLTFSVTAHAKDLYRQVVDQDVFAEVAGAASAVVTVCDANRRHIERLLRGRPARVVRIYNGVPIDRMAPDGSPRDRRLVLGVGRLVEKKGFDVLLDASRVMADRGVDHGVVILGDGEERDGLLLRRAALGLEEHVVMPGASTRDEVLRWMRRARVLAAPCVRAADGNQDALPTVLLEALAVGLPVVSTPVGGIPEIVETGRQGLLAPPGDPVALAGELERLLVDDDAWASMSRAARARAEESFDRRVTVADLVDVFRQSAGRPGEFRAVEASA